MARNNIKLLTQHQLTRFCDKYIFEIIDDKISVETYNYRRKTLHDIDKPFHINSNIRKINFSIDAINIWKEFYERDEKFNLVEVQQNVNKLELMYQPVSTDAVYKMMRKGTKKL